MIVDLMRNDLARLADTGGIAVRSPCALERYETVWQLTSEVTARVRPEVGLVNVFRALFPCGSVTGAPKARGMQLIRELEDSPRGVYCGAIGMVSPPEATARARFSVAIRTVVVDRASWAAEYGTGGGITWASDAAAEHTELLAKAAVLTHRQQDFQLLETMRYQRHEGIRHRDRHLARLVRSAEYFGFRLDVARVTAELDAAIRNLDSAVVRLALHRSGRSSCGPGRCPRHRSGRCCSPWTPSRSTPASRGPTTRRAAGSPTRIGATVTRRWMTCSW